MSEFTTPMMKQYEEIKKQYSDCLLFYRLGDFYELFLEDAHIGAKVLDLTLTGRPRGKDGRIPMAGVPFHAVDSYLAKLVKAGYKVAICEQVSEPDKYGIVDREVVRIVTPGTVLDEKTLTSNENNYIVGIWIDDKYVAISCADISTGEFQTAQFPIENYEQTILNELTRLRPSECIVPKKLYDNPRFLKILKVQQGINIFCFHNWDQATISPAKELKKHFKVQSLASFDIEHKLHAQVVSAALLGYLKETQKDKIDHFKSIATLSSAEHILLDRSTITNLELFSTLRDQDKRGSLLTVLDRTSTAMGGRLIRQWLRKPLTSKGEIDRRHDAIEFFLDHQPLLDSLDPVLEQITDIERTLARLSVGIGNARDMVSLKNSLKLILTSKKMILEHQATALLINSLASIDTAIDETITAIEATIQEDPRFDPKEGGIIKDQVNTKLDELRMIVNSGNDWICELEKKERERTGISSLKVRYNKVFGFYIEVSNSNLTLVPKDYNRKQTLVNGERFTTPELKKQEEIILTAEEKLNELEYSLYTEILQRILTAITSIQKAAIAIATVDTIASFAKLARKENYVRATINTSGEIYIKNGRHPVVEKVLTETQFVPNTVLLNNTDSQVWIITGPNMAGKSVFIRQVALIVLLNQIGSFVPAESASVTLVDKIFVRSGASDVISEGLSTFMVEMVETAQILNQATDKSLIVMDEIGRGTSTYDGISIAWAVAEHLVTNKKSQAKTLFATHYHELQDLEQKYPSKIKNYHMAVHEESGELTFLHTVQEGPASHSFGVAVAKLAGVPESVITNAYSMLHKLEHREQTTQIQMQKNVPPVAQLPLQFDDSEKIITKELHELDIHQMTPLQALNKLSELKNKVKIIEATGDAFFKAD